MAQLPKMSLVAQYDDLCRYTKVLTTGCEEEFKIFVESQRSLLRKLKDYETELHEIRKKNLSLEAEKKKFECQMKHMKNLVEAEVLKRRKLELEKDSMERQIALIKEVLLADGNAIDNQTKEKLFLLSNTTCKQQMETQARLTTIEESIGSLLSPSDIDDTDEDLDSNVSRRRKRRSKGHRRSSGDRLQKKKRSGDVQDPYIEEMFMVDVDALPKGSNFRSSSEPNSNLPELPIPRQVHRSDSEQIKVRNYDLRSIDTLTLPTGSPHGRFSTGGKLSRTHAFVTKTIIRSEKCFPCGHLIKFMKQALKCNDCRITCHPECREQCPLPCIPLTITPTKGSMGTISDYTSSTPPMIPSLIVRCINEIELRGLKEIGLYRISGSEREVKDLKDKLLKGRNITPLNRVDIHAVCGTVKEFLRSLTESLITRSAWQTFVDAADHRDENLSLNLMYEAVCDLPQPNKETLAYFILHLQRVAATPECKMPLENLAKVFGPTIVGYSVAEPPNANMFTETAQQFGVMHRLLMLPTDSWENILNIELPEVFNPQTRTPEITPAPVASRLGPIYATAQKPRSVAIGKTPLSPRNAKRNTKPVRRQFFTSPMLK